MLIELICRRTWTTCRKAVALLKENKIDYRYREYTKEPLDIKEIKELLKKLDVKPKEIFIKNGKMNRKLGLSGEEPDAVLIRAIAQHPTLLKRPIGVSGDKAVLARPIEKLLELAD